MMVFTGILILILSISQGLLSTSATPVINNNQAYEAAIRALNSANIQLRTSETITALLYNVVMGTDGAFMVPFTISNIDTKISSSYALIVVDKDSERVMELTSSSHVIFSDSKVYLAKNNVLVGGISSGKSLGGRFSLQNKPSRNLVGFFFYISNSDFSSYGQLLTSTKSAICDPYVDAACKGVETLAAYLPKREWFQDRVVNTAPQSYGVALIPLGPPGTTNFLKANTKGYRNNNPYWPYYPTGEWYPQKWIGGNYYPDSLMYMGYQSTIDFYWAFLNNQKFYDTISAYSTYLGGAPIRPFSTGQLATPSGPYANVLSMDYEQEMKPITIVSAGRFVYGKYIDNDCSSSPTCIKSFLKWQAENGYITDTSGRNIIGTAGTAQIVAINLAPRLWVNAPDAGGMLCRDICGFHDAVTLSSGHKLYYTVVPYASEESCPSCFNVQKSTIRSIKVIASHELAEVMTRIALQDNYIRGSVAEISDPCSWQYSEVPLPSYTNVGGTCTFQPLWSFESNSCVQIQ